MGSLNDRLRAIREAGDAKRPPEVTAVMKGATEALRNTSILDGVPAVGSPAPSFARPALDGATVRTRTLTRRGPVILSFFRGRW